MSVINEMFQFERCDQFYFSSQKKAYATKTLDTDQN